MAEKVLISPSFPESKDRPEAVVAVPKQSWHGNALYFQHDFDLNKSSLKMPLKHDISA
jgi:hypothetical protein